MPSRIRLDFWCCLGVLMMVGATGCVERRMVIASDPYGAIVYDERNVAIGMTPVDKPFTYYGTHRFRLVRDGCETLVVEEKVRAPWYQWFGIDFISENLIPWTIRDVRYYRYTLPPVQIFPMELVLQQAQGLRDFASTVGTPLPMDPLVNPPPPPMMPPADGPTTLMPPVP
jgi:hypothetical protein